MGYGILCVDQDPIEGYNFDLDLGEDTKEVPVGKFSEVFEGWEEWWLLNRS